MKLAEHVQHIKDTTYQSFDNLFARLGIRKQELAAEDLIPEHQLPHRAKILELVENHKEEGDGYPEARERALDELTFTLFNRIAAVKVMEAKILFPEIITKRAENGDRSFQHKAWLEQNPDMRSKELEGLREFIKFAFNNLGEELALYHKSYPYALLPNTIELNEIIDAFNAVEKDKDIEDEIWASDDILGWLYESYNNDKKKDFKESGDKTEYDKVSLQSQVYTPRWVVEFLVNNSLGKLYLEMYPTSDIKDRKKIANAPKKQLRTPKPLHEVTLIDPAPGSGNFLLYAFDLFYELYIDQIEYFGADYDEADIPRLIIENNLYGIDLDDRAVQLAQLGLYIKAKSKQRNTSVPDFQVVSSDFYLPDYETVRPLFEDGGKLQTGVTDLLQEIWDDLQNAHRFGSLLKIEDRVNRRLQKLKEDPMDLFVQEEMVKYEAFEEKFFPRIKEAVHQYAGSNTTAFVQGKTLDALTYLEIISQKYDVAVANPPYTDSSDFGPELKKFIDNNYKEPHKFHSNLYATFIKRCFELTNEDGKLGLIHPMTFMYIKSFEDVRKFIIDKTHVNLFVEYGLSNLFGAVMADPAFYVLEKSSFEYDDSIFIRLDPYTRTPQEKFKKDFCLTALDSIVNGNEDKHVYHLPQSKLKLIKGWPFIYWISDGFREKFREQVLDDVLDIRAGIQTSNNLRFLRFWWEVEKENLSLNHAEDDLKWVRYAKGGPFSKWYGNLWLVIDWAKNGQVLQDFLQSIGQDLHAQQYYFKEGITYSASGSKGLSFRTLPKNSLFDIGGSSIFAKNGEKVNFEHLLAVLNSKLTTYITNCLNPTVNKQPNDLKRIPFVDTDSIVESKVGKLSKSNILLNQKILSFKSYERCFSSKKSTLGFQKSKPLPENISSFLVHENKLITIQLINEAIINDLTFQEFDLSKQDIEQVLQSEGVSVGEYPIHPEALRAFKETIEDSEYTTEALWQKLDEIEQNEQVIEKKAKLEKEFPKLYQSNYGFEEFCIKNEVNPINAWYWFRESEIIPQQRAHDIALEFLADLFREILMEDEDGIIPLVRNAGEEILIDRLERKMQEKGFSTAQISQLDGLLGRPLNEYIEEHFFKELSDHLNLFMYLPRTPFIWHLSSGPNQGFECYLVIYKWSRDKLLTLKSVYIEKRERALKNRVTDLGDRSDAASQNERDTIRKQLAEIEEFKAKIDELLASGYDPKLDDGVGKNIAPLQKMGMIPYDVLTKNQLKKYLNADW